MEADILALFDSSECPRPQEAIRGENGGSWLVIFDEEDPCHASGALAERRTSRLPCPG